ncbi:hypothetical protein LV469_01865 [Peptoniphilus sp. GNH]|nr:hypothetical protein HMPREF3189_00089 [Clostridiales bacterium KA00134]UHR03054.1 hypothetical protein LV469_01865 [Peptoniphilus sp. GNH]
MRIKNLDQLKRISNDLNQELLLRSLGNKHENEVIEIVITGNGKEEYSTVAEGISNLKDYVNEIDGDDVKFLFKNDPSQQAAFNIKISASFQRNIDTDEIDSEKIKELVSRICQIKAEEMTCGRDKKDLIKNLEQKIQSKRRTNPSKTSNKKKGAEK